MNGNDPPISTCRSCGAEVIWTVTERENKMPVDAEPVKGGSFFLDYSRSSETPKARFIPEHERPTTPLYVSHFSTCPESKDWRKRR